MAEPAAPGQFSSELEKWISTKCRPSVFFVMLTPEKGQIKAFKARLAQANILAADARSAEVKKNRVGTAFVVEAGQNGLKVLTCAHLIDYVFNAINPISAEEANLLFKTQILCDHAEVQYLEAIAAGRKAKRAYSVATIVDINCEKDLMLLQIPSAKVFRCVSATDRNLVCTNSHPPIFRGLNPSEELDECMMIAWPAEKHNTVVKGRVSNCSRTVKVMEGNNPNGYSMKLLQVDMRSEGGASGSALLNGQADCVGVLHGGDVQFSYFISWEDLSRFLDRNRVPRRM